jgi:uncharacterized membrane protein YadS
MIKKAANLWHKIIFMPFTNLKPDNNIKLNDVLGYGLILMACILLCNSFLEENIITEKLSSSLSLLSFLLGMLLLNFSSKKSKP